MSGRAATDRVIRGRAAISVNDPGHPTPSGWSRVALTDVADLGTGHTPSRHKPEYWDGSIGWIGIRDAGAHHGGVIHETSQTITPLGVENSAARLLPKDTICLSRTASVGYVVKMGAPMTTSQDFVTWSCTKALDPDYLLRALLAEGGQIRRFGEGSTHTTIYFPAVKAFTIDLPPLAEQRRIVAKLDALTARLAQARTQLDLVPLMVRNLRQSALSVAQFGLLSAPWRQARPAIPGAATALEKVRGIRENGRKPIRRVVGATVDLPLPKTWAQISPDELAADVPYSIGIGPFGSDLVKADYRESGTRLVFVRDIRAQQFGHEGARYVSGEKAEKLKAHFVQSGDVLVTKMGDPPGDVALFAGNGPAIITADCIKLRAHRQLAEPDYLMFCLRFPFVQAQILAATKGVAQQKISLNSFRRMVLPIPPVAEQRQIATMLHAAFARADRLEAEAARARALLDRLEAAILAKAFRGELVPQDPNDEPVSVLLDRISAERAAAPKPKRGRARKAVG